MANLGVITTVEIRGDADMFVRAAKAMRNPRPFFNRIGVLGLTSASKRLETVLKVGGKDAVRSGRLSNSLTLRGVGNIFDLADTQVEIGSNLPYAAQVNYGGTILPKKAKALAIPLPVRLKREGLWPSEMDPQRKLLKFIPIHGKANLIGLLVDPGKPLEGKQRKRRASEAAAPFTKFAQALYVLATSVFQKARPFLYWDETDRQFIRDELWPQHVRENQ